MNISTAVKYCCIFHGRVFVMTKACYGNVYVQVTVVVEFIMTGVGNVGPESRSNRKHYLYGSVYPNLECKECTKACISVYIQRVNL